MRVLQALLKLFLRYKPVARQIPTKAHGHHQQTGRLHPELPIAPAQADRQGGHSPQPFTGHRIGSATGPTRARSGQVAVTEGSDPTDSRSTLDLHHIATNLFDRDFKAGSAEAAASTNTQLCISGGSRAPSGAGSNRLMKPGTSYQILHIGDRPPAKGS